MIDTITTLGARATPAVLLSVIAICRQYLTEPEQQTVHADFNRTQNNPSQNHRLKTILPPWVSTGA